MTENRAGWAMSRRSRGSFPVTTSVTEKSRYGSNASSQRSIWSRKTGSASSSSRPMPAHWGPWPGKTNTTSRSSATVPRTIPEPSAPRSPRAIASSASTIRSRPSATATARCSQAVRRVARVWATSTASSAGCSLRCRPSWRAWARRACSLRADRTTGNTAEESAATAGTRGRETEGTEGTGAHSSTTCSGRPASVRWTWDRTPAPRSATARATSVRSSPQAVAVRSEGCGGCIRTVQWIRSPSSMARRSSFRTRTTHPGRCCAPSGSAAPPTSSTSGTAPVGRSHAAHSAAAGTASPGRSDGPLRRSSRCWATSPDAAAPAHTRPASSHAVHAVSSRSRRRSSAVPERSAKKSRSNAVTEGASVPPAGRCPSPMIASTFGSAFLANRFASLARGGLPCRAERRPSGVGGGPGAGFRVPRER